MKVKGRNSLELLYFNVEKTLNLPKKIKSKLNILKIHTKFSCFNQNILLSFDLQILKSILKVLHYFLSQKQPNRA